MAALSELMNIGVGELSARIGLAEGSPEKTVLHAAVGALTAMVAGGNVASGALAGAASELANGVLQQVLRANPNLTDEQKAAITQWVGTAVGALAGGQLGAATGLDNVIHNYLTHKQLQDLATDLKACDAAADAASCKAEVSKKYEDIDFKQERDLEACRTSACLNKLVKEMDLDENNLFKTIYNLQELGLDPGFAQRLFANQVNERPLTGNGSILSQRIEEIRAGVEYCESSGQASGCFVTGQMRQGLAEAATAAVYGMLGARYGGTPAGKPVEEPGRPGNSAGEPARLSEPTEGSGQTQGGGRSGSALPSIYTEMRPLDAEFPQLKGINPGYAEGEPGTTTNCVSCVNAFMDRMAGDLNATASPGGTQYESRINVWGTRGPMSVESAIKDIESLGNGAYGAVVIAQPGTQHVIGFLNLEGRAVFIDPQSNSIVRLSPNFQVKVGDSLHIK